MTPSNAHRFSLTNDVANRIVIPVLRSGAGKHLGRRLAVVEYLGRRSGEHHELVSSYVINGATVTLRVGAPDHKTWWRNFQEPHPVRLRLAGIDHDTSAQAVRDRDRVTVSARLE
jgi:hypothetical protein